MKSELRSSREIEMKSSGALRLRDVADFVKAAHQFGCSVMLLDGETRVDGKKFVELAHWHFREGEQVKLETWGFDAGECIAALTEILKRGQGQALKLEY
jgi:phosphotransferase system HPr-like phosphotransfer protein